MKLWDEIRVAALERALAQREGELKEVRAEAAALRDRLARLEGQFDVTLRQLSRLEADLGTVRDALPKHGIGTMAFAAGALAAAEADAEAGEEPEGDPRGFMQRLDEFWGTGLSNEEMLRRGAFVGGREKFPELTPAEEEEAAT